MLRFLLHRPIGVLMFFIAVVSISILAYFTLPISLLPDIDVPELSIVVECPNCPPEEVEENVLKPIRENMLSLVGLKSCESIAQQERGIVTVSLEYDADINLAYIETNEKIDRLTRKLPASIERPQVIKTNFSDIPIVRLQVIPQRRADHLTVSELTVNVLKRRIEQIDGIGFVDVNGIHQKVVRISPDEAKMKSHGLTDEDISRTIQQANLEFGWLSVKDGNYSFFLKIATQVDDLSSVSNLSIHIPGTSSTIRLNQLASVSLEADTPAGFHLFNTEEGIVISIHKQTKARIPELMPKIYNVVKDFEAEFPGVSFHLTQDQSRFLLLSIENLSQALIWGGAFAFIVLFLFMGGWREPIIMGIILPISLVICCSLLYLFNISLNIISLSGLALGLGMLVDNSIVVIDNIALKRDEGLSLVNSCVHGTEEVITPLVSSALTNLAVFIPLIFLSGITGALFLDQAIAVTSILFISIVSTFILVPLLYLVLNRKERMNKNRQDSRIFIWLKTRYHHSFLWVWSHKAASLSIMILLIPVSLYLLITLQKEGFPKIERHELMLAIDWNEPIDARESLNRTKALIVAQQQQFIHAESEIGIQQFDLTLNQQTAQQVSIYFKFSHEAQKDSMRAVLTRQLMVSFPRASVEFSHPSNPFDQLFLSNKPFYEMRLRNLSSRKPIDLNVAADIISGNQNVRAGKGFETEPMAFIHLNIDKMRLYGIEPYALQEKLKIVFGDYHILSFKNFGEVLPVHFERSSENFESALRSTDIQSVNGKSYPLQTFVAVTFKHNYKNITADQSGIFQSLIADFVADEPAIRSQWVHTAERHQLNADFTGTWFDNRKNLNQLAVILLISFILMYLIITAEFQSFGQPLLVLMSIPIGFSGSLILLWLTGGTLNIMSGIGFVVVLGILDNDAILKIDRINSLAKTLPLSHAIEQAGLDRFKPIVMNTCTNVLALTPILFSSGLGADLQRPVAITTIGGLIIATLTALYFIPIVYWLFSNQRHYSETSTTAS